MKPRVENHWNVKLAFAFCAVLFLPSLVLAQTGKDQNQDEQETPYTEEEYAAYKAATTDPDLAKRQTLMIQFMTDNPESKLNPYIVTAYQQLLREYFSKNQYGPLAAAAEQYLAYDPNDLVSIAMASEGYRNLGNHEKYVVFGQKVFANTPSGGDAYRLTKSFEALKKDDEYIKWANKTMELLPTSSPAYYSINLELLSRMTRMYMEKRQMAKAVSTAQKLLPILSKAPKPEKASAAEWKRFIRGEANHAWSLIGEWNYNREKWQASMKAYKRSIAYVRKSDLAYYRIGLCYWKLQDVDNAIDNFALAYVLNGQMKKNAYGYLEQLYKALHNNTTVGMDKVINRARKAIKG